MAENPDELIVAVADALFEVRAKLPHMSRETFRATVAGAFTSVEGLLNHLDKLEQED